MNPFAFSTEWIPAHYTNQSDFILSKFSMFAIPAPDKFRHIFSTEWIKINRFLEIKSLYYILFHFYFTDLPIRFG